MQIALFLDVDGTLTRDPIQSYFAHHMKVDDRYRTLEDGFQNETMTSTEFGHQLVALFASVGFTEEKALAAFSQVELHPWAERLLSLQDEDVHIFLVSNGPSYYINELARRRSIPRDRVCCSRYFFNSPGSVISGCDAVSDQGKARFVQEQASRYTFSIGIGDSPQHDGPFIAQCTFGFLTVPTDSYLYVPSLEHIISLVARLKSMQATVGIKRGAFDPLPMTIKELISSLPVRAWAAFGGLLAATFTAGTFVGRYWP